MNVFILRDSKGNMWGIKSSYNNAVIFLDAGSAMQAWQNLGSSANPYEVIEVEMKEITKLIKVFDEPVELAKKLDELDASQKKVE
jgi:hypothetical protein